VAKEMGLLTPIALRLDRDAFAAFHSRDVQVTENGLLICANDQ
jgi:hypothetical protein